MRKVLYLFSIIFYLTISNYAIAETYVLLTVDVESFDSGNPEKDIWGRLEGYDGEYGVPLILNILQKNNTRATFYLNVYEIAKFGEEKVKGIAGEIISHGQDLQLHTHPSPIYGKEGMSSFNSSEQEKILRKGKKLIYEWTGKDVISHRAGNYLGNIDTIHALKKVGICVDSSLCPVYSSPLFLESYRANDIVDIEGVLEIPITYFTQVKFMGWESLRFLDIESSSLRELKNVLDDMAEKGSCAINIMMHSFSITRYGYPDQRVVKKLDALLKYINENPRLTATDTETFFNAYRENKLACYPHPEFVPHTGLVFTYLRSWERFAASWKNVFVALSLPVLIIILTISLILLKRKKYIKGQNIEKESAPTDQKTKSWKFHFGFRFHDN